MKLYGSKRSRTARVLWLLQELGLSHEHEPIEPGSEAAQSPAYRALNPAGKVPTLQVGEFVMTESLAINLWLSQQAGAPMWPIAAEAQARALQWTLWVGAELEPLTSGIGKALRLGGLDADAVIAANRAAAAPLLDGLEQRLSTSPFLAGEAFCVADLNVASVLVYAPMFGLSLTSLPYVQAWLNTIVQRPAYQWLTAH